MQTMVQTIEFPSGWVTKPDLNSHSPTQKMQFPDCMHFARGERILCSLGSFCHNDSSQNIKLDVCSVVPTLWNNFCCVRTTTKTGVWVVFKWSKCAHCGQTRSNQQQIDGKTKTLGLKWVPQSNPSALMGDEMSLIWFDVMNFIMFCFEHYCCKKVWETLPCFLLQYKLCSGSVFLPKKVLSSEATFVSFKIHLPAPS